MQKVIILFYKGLRKTKHILLSPIHKLCTNFIFYCNGVKASEFKTQGIPYVVVARGGKCTIGKNFSMNNSIYSNPIGRIQKCIIVVDRGAEIVIGDNVKMSFTAINSQVRIIIKDNVMIGGGTCIYDSDFHPLNVKDRLEENNKNIQKAPVIVEKNVFIGTNSTILKGVTIGAGSIVGACSVVTKSIPPGEIWAGNPARFLKKINE